jgi:hypothetical protein
VTQPSWSARSQSARDLIPPSPPTPREVNVTFSMNGIVAVLLGGLILRLLIAYVIFPGEGFGNDLRLYGAWAQTLADHGPGGFYANAGWTDYPPGYLYVLWFVGVLGNLLSSPLGMPAGDVIDGLLKMPAILADLAVAWLLYRAASRWHGRRAGLAAAALYTFIPVTWYDSALWGQVDSVGALLLVWMALLLIDGWDEQATLVAVLAAVVKPQFAIGLLIVAAVLAGRYLLGRLPEEALQPTGLGGAVDRLFRGWFSQQHGPARLIACTIVGIVAFIVLILPFDLQVWASSDWASTPVLGQAAGFAVLVQNAAGYYNVLTANAFNAWAVAGPTPLSQVLSTGDLQWTWDTRGIFGAQASTLGMALFAAIALLVMASVAWRNDRTAIVLGLTVLAVAFFAVPTRVHERYLFPAFGIGAFLAAASVGWRWWYLILGLASTVNLHAILTLPYKGYGTEAMRNLPLADQSRSEIAIVAVAIIVTAALLVTLAVFLWTVARPALAEAWPGLESWYQSAGGAPPPKATPEEEFWGWGDKGAPRGPVGTSVIGRVELGFALLLVLLTFGFRTYQLGTPKGMYFDEIFYAGSATEFLQDWRYGMPHDISETTHPPFGKYIIAGGLALAGHNEVTLTRTMAWTVNDATYEPTFLDPTAADGRSGDRIILATGSGIVVATHGALDDAILLPLAGARAVTVDTVSHRIFVGTSDGTIWEYSSGSLGLLAEYGTIPHPARIANVGVEIDSLRPVNYSGLLVRSKDSVRLVDLATSSVPWRLAVPGISGIETYILNGRWVALAATPDGLLQLDPTNLQTVSEVPLLGGAKGMDLVYGNPTLKAWRNLLREPTLYVATGTATLELLTFDEDNKLVDRNSFRMPGTVTDVKWNPATNLVHVLGKTRDGTQTVFVVEPNSNSTFADAKIEFPPAAWVVDAQADVPGLDRERVIVFSGAGTYSVIDAGSNAFAWRLPAVIAGALLAGLLYLLAMVLFHRRSVGLILAALISVDGLIFGRSRIAGVDVYLALFIVAAFLVLAYLLQSRAWGKRALLEGLLLPPLVGVLLGLAVATKWPGLYAIGGAGLIVLFRSVPGRWLALAGMVGLTGFLGYLALAARPENTMFALLMFGLTALLAIGIVRARPVEETQPRWADPRWRRGLPFAWVIACLTVVPLAVYVASFIPWALSAGGSPQLFAGWPPGHTGQTFGDLQVQMYNYHNEWRYGHAAASPWWAWPFDLKPVWAYLENMLNGQATIIEAGNPFLFWLTIPAAAFGMWQAWSRRDQSLGLLAVGALALWLPWARIDRVTYDYHFYPTLLFGLVLLAYFLAELWERPSLWTWRLARFSTALVVVAPALMWLALRPLCYASGVADTKTWQVCDSAWGTWPGWVLPWLGVGLVAGLLAWRFVKPRQLVIGVLAGLAVAFLAMYPALSAWQVPDQIPGRYIELLPTWNSSFVFGYNNLEAVKPPILTWELAVCMAAAVAAPVLVLLANGWRPVLPVVRVRFGRGGNRNRD